MPSHRRLPPSRESQLTLLAKPACEPALAFFRGRRSLLSLAVHSRLSLHRHGRLLRDWWWRALLLLEVASSRLVPVGVSAASIANREGRGLIRRALTEANPVVVGRLLWFGRCLDALHGAVVTRRVCLIASGVGRRATPGAGGNVFVGPVVVWDGVITW